MNKRLAISVTLFIILSLGIVSVCVDAQSGTNIVINTDGSVTGTNSIQQLGNTYTLTTNLTGNIQVKKSDIVINGAGYTFTGNNNGGIDLTNDLQHEYNNPTISNVTIENMYIENAGIGTNGGGNNTFYNDVFSSVNRQEIGFAIQLLGCSYNNISYCNFDNKSQISMDYSAAFNTVTKCNLPPYGILVWLSGYDTADNNYWSDYLTKYTNATEIDHSGVGNQPYVYYYSDDNTAPNGTIMPIIYQDNHPLMKPVVIPLTGSSSQLNTPSPTYHSGLFPQDPLVIIAIALIVIIPLLAVIVLVLRHQKPLS